MMTCVLNTLLLLPALAPLVEKKQTRAQLEGEARASIKAFAKNPVFQKNIISRQTVDSILREEYKGEPRWTLLLN